MAKNMKNLNIHKVLPILAAPIAGYTDFSFRRILRECGADLVYTEMVSATALFHGSEKTKGLLRMHGNTAVQLFGKNPEHFVFAIKSGLLDSFSEININMGCPAKKIVKNGEGSALMKNLPLAREIIRACVGATNKPVTVKMRIGYLYSDGNVALELAKICEEEGVSKIIVHGRWQEQGYSGKADWTEIAKVKRAVGIPVFANGDVKCLESYSRCIEETGCDGVMIARGLIGSPWVISLSEKPPAEEIRALIKRHIAYAREEHGDSLAIREMKKHLLFYADSLKVAKREKTKLAVANSFEEIASLLAL